MKFVNGYDPVFLGAEGWEYGPDAVAKYKPFYAITYNGIIIVDAGGISYYSYSECDSCGNMKEWSNQKPIESFSEAVLIVISLEEMDLDKFADYVKLTYEEIM